MENQKIMILFEIGRLIDVAKYEKATYVDISSKKIMECNDKIWSEIMVRKVMKAAMLKKDKILWERSGQDDFVVRYVVMR